MRLVIVWSMTLDCREGRSDPMSEAFLQMADVFSQLELSMIRMRVRSGMANARAKGKVDRQTPTHCRKHSRNLSSALSRL